MKKKPGLYILIGHFVVYFFDLPLPQGIRINMFSVADEINIKALLMSFVVVFCDAVICCFD